MSYRIRMMILTMMMMQEDLNRGNCASPLAPPLDPLLGLTSVIMQMKSANVLADP